MAITVGGFYLARIEILWPERKFTTVHVTVMRAIDGDRWEVFNTHIPKERHIVTASQLEPESDAMRASREESWRLWGRPKAE